MLKKTNTSQIKKLYESAYNLKEIYNKNDLDLNKDNKGNNNDYRFLNKNKEKSEFNTLQGRRKLTFPKNKELIEILKYNNNNNNNSYFKNALSNQVILNKSNLSLNNHLI